MNANRLSNEKSPYLLQHAKNPVDWYPWCNAAFDKAEKENKPVFLSIGYSTCHWCHVMAHESFESEIVAKALNNNFVSVKVDREERPDIDNVYMKVCQALTGSGGWPMSIFMTPDKKPFVAGTYFPKEHFILLINKISDMWQNDKAMIYASADKIKNSFVNAENDTGIYSSSENIHTDKDRLVYEAAACFEASFDKKYGGFEHPPKFPAPHNLMFLSGIKEHIAEKALMQMYKGGIFDHIGGGFSRYSTDEKWLVPHFEKMLYDNALLAIAYTMYYSKTEKELFKYVTERVLRYLTAEMKSEEGGFYTAQDADSDGEEGLYYMFSPEEIKNLLGYLPGSELCRQYDITEKGNYNGKSIPNLISYENATADELFHLAWESRNKFDINTLYEYRKKRFSLHTDKKIITSNNGLTAAAFIFAGRVFDNEEYINTGEKIIEFIKNKLIVGNMLFTCITSGKISGPAFLDDYAFYIFALIQLFKARGEKKTVDEISTMINQTISDFFDKQNGGFFFSGTKNEQLIFNVKETYDGAVPSGNSMMTYNLSQLIKILGKLSSKDAGTSDMIENIKKVLNKHINFMNNRARTYPAGHSFYLLALNPPKKTECGDGFCRPGEEIL